MLRSGESEIRMILRMKDTIDDLRTQLDAKDVLVSELRAKVMDKNEVVVELKTQLAESKQPTVAKDELISELRATVMELRATVVEKIQANVELQRQLAVARREVP